jgi:hypothetical protein
MYVVTVIRELHIGMWWPSMYVVIMQSGYHADRPDTRMNCDDVPKQ